MKKSVWIIGIVLLLCASVCTAGPKISGQIKNFNYIEGSENVAVDKSQANMGTVRVVGKSHVTGVISNHSVIRNSANMAKNDSTANMGSVDVVNSAVSGDISSTNFINNSQNISDDGGTVSMGGVMLNNTNRSGDVHVYYDDRKGSNQNIATGQKSVFQGSVVAGYEGNDD